MLEDLRRNHDTTPDAQERAWMDFRPRAVAARLSLMTAVAVMIGVMGSQLANPPAAASAPATVASAAAPAR